LPRVHINYTIVWCMVAPNFMNSKDTSILSILLYNNLWKEWILFLQETIVADIWIHNRDNATDIKQKSCRTKKRIIGCTLSWPGQLVVIAPAYFVRFVRHARRIRRRFADITAPTTHHYKLRLSEMVVVP
jgi:hypothetical protein